MGVMKERLGEGLAIADRVFCYAPPSLGWDAAAALHALGDKAQVHDDLERLADAVVAASRPGDHVVVMSNGDFGGIHGKLLQRLKAGHG
jgi:UDP-N-acetylmuramate: L-alanyl-gamma-D-glutamyl-meso-diaminopimelate ligase